MARPRRPVSGNDPQPEALTAAGGAASFASPAAVYRPGKRVNQKTDRYQIAKPWQVEAYRQINICGEARYAANLFASLAGRAEIGVSEPNSLTRKAVWVESGPEVDAFADIVPTVRERSKLIRDYMLHRVVAGECYLVARRQLDTDPEYAGGITDEDLMSLDALDPNFDPTALPDSTDDTFVWEIVAVTELQKVGETWKLRHDNNNYVELADDEPAIRMWNPDPENRREAWSPFRSLLPTLREIEWLTKHIFTQVRSRLMSSGVWFMPNNITFPPPPPDAVEGGADAIAMMNEAEQFMLSLAHSSMSLLDDEEVAFPSIVMADPLALAQVDQQKLIQFWSEIDDKAMILRSDAVRRFALGMDLPPEQVLGSSGLAVTGAAGSAGSVNHWGVWAQEEQTISSHVEPALDDFVGTLTTAVLRKAVPDTDKVIAYDTATLRLRQDRSKEALEWYDRGILKAEVALRETGFDPESDIMDSAEHKMWLLNRITSGSATPEQIQAALTLLGVPLPMPALPAPDATDGTDGTAPQISDNGLPPSLKDHPYEGPPRVDHDHNEAPYSVLCASAEALVLRALEKYGNRLLNNGKRGRDKDRSTPAHRAHEFSTAETGVNGSDFDFSLAPTMLSGMTAVEMRGVVAICAAYCADLVETQQPYNRDALAEALRGRS